MSSKGLVDRFVESEESHFTVRSLITLIVGLLVGFCFAELFVLSMPKEPDWLIYRDYIQLSEQSRHFLNSKDPETFVDTHDHIKENNTIAQKLFNETRVLCWIMTNPNNHQSKARHVKQTWGKRCNKLLFMSSQLDKDFDVVALNVSEGRNNLWAKTKEAFKYIYKHHFDEADWFFKADDDTYTVVENLRYMLHPYSPETPNYFGFKFKTFVKQGYMSGGSGYVLSKEAVRRFVEEGLPDPNKCKQTNDGAEDVEMGKCLEKVKVVAGDSRDSNGGGRFFPLAIGAHLMPSSLQKDFWYWSYTYYKSDEGLKSFSDYAISFHYVEPKFMYVFDYLIYHLRPYGVVTVPEDLPERSNTVLISASSKNGLGKVKVL